MPIEQQELFVNGQNGYPFYRIPALIVAPDGSLLAFAEGRKDNNNDQGGIDILVRRSHDQGITWSPQQLVASDGDNTVGNPTPIIDRETGIIWLLLCWNYGNDTEDAITKGSSQETRHIWLSSSKDNGLNWTTPEDITASTKQKSWGWYATGPGVGIQLQNGRLLIPCDHTVVPEPTNYSHVIYSDDHGASWQIGGTLGPHVNECQAVELANGTVLLNMRNEWHLGNARAVATSVDGGINWSTIQHHPTLIEPQCQASIVRLPGINGEPERLLFANPASTARENMTVRVSYDDGKTWPIAKCIYAGPGAYSCLTILSDRSIGLLYERGPAGATPEHDADKIVFARFSLDWLEAGTQTSNL